MPLLLARALGAVRTRRDGGLDQPRARSRTSAFVYGNITVLAAVVALERPAVADGAAVLVVAVTAATTFVAHVVADLVAERVGGHAQPAPGELGREVRDSLPVATSGSLPAVVLALGALGVLAAPLAQVLAAAVVVVRLALTGLVVERVSGRPASAAALWSGVGLAVLSAVVATVKAVLGH